MDFRTVMVLRPSDFGKGGGMWAFIGLLLIGWAIIRSDPDYKTSEEATREVSSRFERNSVERHMPTPNLSLPRLSGGMGDLMVLPRLPMLPIDHRGPPMIHPIPETKAETSG